MGAKKFAKMLLLENERCEKLGQKPKTRLLWLLAQLETVANRKKVGA